MSMQQVSWRDSYRRLAAQFIGADRASAVQT